MNSEESCQGNPDLEVVRFTVPGIPRGKARPRAAIVAGRARIYTPQMTVSEEGAVRLFASQAMQGRPPIEGAIYCSVFAFFPVPASWSNKKRQRALSGDIKPTSRPDFDNVAKLVTDACKQIVWADDAQITDFKTSKRYAADPRVVVEVRQA